MPNLTVAAAALALATAMPASVQTVRPPAAPPLVRGMVLVDHDEGEHGHGRKLGHFKKHHDEDEDDDEDNNAARSSTRRSRRSTTAPWTNPAPYYPAPGYGYAYPPPSAAPYGYYPPPYYRGY